MDVMKDQSLSNLWLASEDGTRHRPLTSGNRSDVDARWSPAGDQIAWVSSSDGSGQIQVRYADTAETATVSRLTEAPRGLAWSPNGRQIASSCTSPSRRSRSSSRRPGRRALIGLHNGDRSSPSSRGDLPRAIAAIGRARAGRWSRDLVPGVTSERRPDGCYDRRPWCSRLSQSRRRAVAQRSLGWGSCLCFSSSS